MKMFPTSWCFECLVPSDTLFWVVLASSEVEPNWRKWVALWQCIINGHFPFAFLYTS